MMLTGNTGWILPSNSRSITNYAPASSVRLSFYNSATVLAVFQAALARIQKKGEPSGRSGGSPPLSSQL